MVRIFIAHSSKDEWLINPIASNLKLIPVEPYLAEVDIPSAKSLPQKLNDAIESSEAVFVFWTSNVANNQETRDVVNWEISAAYHMKPRKPIYVFVEEGVRLPMMMDYITVYSKYDPLDKEKLNKMTFNVQEVASCVKIGADNGRLVAFIIMGILGLSVLALASSGK